MSARCRGAVLYLARGVQLLVAAQRRVVADQETPARRREDALAAVEEAVEIRRELARERPDAFRPDLATSLNNLSLELGTWEEALVAIEEAVAIRRQLAARWLAAFQPALARSLLNRADILDRLQRTAEADASRAEAANWWDAAMPAEATVTTVGCRRMPGARRPVAPVGVTRSSKTSWSAPSARAGAGSR